jgi:endonuclease/exonuclease/phosphatase (EEP) superfamily protein YafD
MKSILPLLRFFGLALGIFSMGGTALSLTRGQHWFVRLWDFPRVQLALMSAVSAFLVGAFGNRKRAEAAFVGGLFATIAWQLRKILSYTPLRSVEVMRSERGPGPGSFSLMISNVLMENREHGRVLDLVRRVDPDVILLVETDESWSDSLAPLKETHPYAVEHPQDNYYGLLLFSRLPLIEPEVRFLVQDDIPSVHTGIKLRDGTCITLHGLHPRPPEPVRDQNSKPRDAELVIVGKAIGKDERQPTIVAGDLNDVAWSPTSELFLRLSGLLDPRKGRGFYNSYNANSTMLRYPLDHVFHSNHFRLLHLERLPSIGSDHFPMLVELSYEPDAPTDQPKTEKEPGDEAEAREKIDNQEEAAATGDDRPRNE